MTPFHKPLKEDQIINDLNTKIFVEKYICGEIRKNCL